MGKKHTGRLLLGLFCKITRGLCQTAAQVIAFSGIKMKKLIVSDF